MWLDYDAEADVLYLHFEEKPVSTHNEMRNFLTIEMISWSG
jgi:uncharacterized protein YuzE